jgi:hypothetical protein
MRREVCKISAGTCERQCQGAQSEADKGGQEALRQVAIIITTQRVVVSRVDLKLT